MLIEKATMNARRLVPIIVGLLLSLAPAIGSAQQFTYYNYISDREVTQFGEIIWFWTPDTLWGPVHSNDYLGVKYGPVFFGPVTTSKRELRQLRPDRLDSVFRGGITYGVPSHNFPVSIHSLRSNAGLVVSDSGGRLMTWVKLLGEDGIDIFQYPLGEAPAESLLQHIDPPHNLIIWVNGQVELEGLLSGRFTIGASDDIWLINDVRYLGSDSHTGDFDERDMRSMLAVVSENNIFIRDNLANGKGNGRAVEPDNWDRHSIVLNGSYIALGESFTFQHQNDDWDAYQGPTPDERGTCFLKGGIVNLRRGYLHRSNHIGTGYGRHFGYDSRLLSEAPPGFESGSGSDVFGTQDRLVLHRGRYDVNNAHIGTLILEPGVILDLKSADALLVTDSLIAEGTETDSIHFRPWAPYGGLIVEPGATYASLKYVNLYGGEIVAAKIICENTLMQSSVSMEGDVSISECIVTDSLSISSWSKISVSRSLLLGGLTLRGAPEQCQIDHCTITNAEGAGVILWNGVEAAISNSIIAFNGDGVANHTRFEPTLRYCDVFGNRRNDLQNGELGVGSISADPRFSDRRDGDFGLAFHSPCIDAGDPASPRDPDGSRADMGAYGFDRELGIEKFGIWNLEFRMTASPNPFNSTTEIKLVVPKAGKVTVAVYDLSGRVVARLFDGRVEQGERRFSWDASGVPAGVYLVGVKEDGVEKVVKLVKLD